MLNASGSTKILKKNVFNPVMPHEKVDDKSRMYKVQKTLNSDGFP